MFKQRLPSSVGNTLPAFKRHVKPFCHSLYIEGAGVLIDPASDRNRLKRLREESGVKTVWLSHWHEDHLCKSTWMF
jgi:glyoxylase-like metal-dependent hydrolase (beta-lactamase superfamily II)